ncbi:MAG: AraC family transcriptional regulator [Spirochaetaceae bacterium]|nr:MAG: AraC family transcriptional regulator [Spirochaetaceae bacterium]
MDLLELLAMLGAAQGVLLLLLIVVRFRGRANLPLALLLLTFSIRLGTIPSWNPETLLRYRWLLPLAGPLPLLFGPLVWRYVRELVRPDSRRPRRAALHALPWALETALLAAFFLSLGPADYRLLIADLFNAPVPWWMPLRHLLKLVSGTAYAVVAGRMAFGADSASVAPQRRLWARVVVAAPLVSMLAFIAVAAQPAAAADNGFSPFYLPAAAMMISVYALAMLVLIAPGVLAVGNGSAAPRASNGLAQDEIRQIAARVEQHLAAGAFRDPELTLAGLAHRIEVHPNRLSAAVNRAFGENFSQLLHRRRLDCFLQQVAAGELERHTILRLALEAGFPSKSTFNRVFKQRFGTTPSEYVRLNASDTTVATAAVCGNHRRSHPGRHSGNTSLHAVTLPPDHRVT